MNSPVESAKSVVENRKPQDSSEELHIGITLFSSQQYKLYVDSTATQEQENSYYYCNHRRGRTKYVNQNPEEDIDHSDETKILNTDDFKVGETMKLDGIELHLFECPDCKKQEWRCNICMGRQSFIEEQSGKRVDCPKCRKHF